MPKRRHLYKQSSVLAINVTTGEDWRRIVDTRNDGQHDGMDLMQLLDSMAMMHGLPTAEPQSKFLIDTYDIVLQKNVFHGIPS